MADTITEGASAVPTVKSELESQLRGEVKKINSINPKNKEEIANVRMQAEKTIHQIKLARKAETEHSQLLEKSMAETQASVPTQKIKMPTTKPK